MNIEKLYDKVAHTYNQSTSSKVLNKAKKIAVGLMVAHRQSLQSILALGIGDGSDLLLYKKHYPNAELHGLDISKNMLVKAKEHLNFVPYHGDMSQASSLIPKHDFDLITAHFVTAYLPLSVTLQEAQNLLSQHGVISIITNTKASFPNGQAMLAKLNKSANPITKMIARHIKKSLQNTYVPTDISDLQSILKSHSFHLLDVEEISIPIQLKTEEEVFQFFINGGWCAQGLVHPVLPHWLILWMSRQLIRRCITIPYQDTVHIAIAIAEHE